MSESAARLDTAQVECHARPAVGRPVPETVAATRGIAAVAGGVGAELDPRRIQAELAPMAQGGPVFVGRLAADDDRRRPDRTLKRAAERPPAALAPVPTETIDR